MKELTYEELNNPDPAWEWYYKFYVLKGFDHMCSFDWFKKHIWSQVLEKN